MSAVDRLIEEGRYEEAAASARHDGDFRRAAALYERIWDFAAAADCARRDDDLPRALRYAIDAGDEPLVAELITLLSSSGGQGKAAAIAVLARRLRYGEAGALAEAAGDMEGAVQLYRQGHRDLDAARLLESLGRDREAGQLLERLVEHAEGDPALAPARLRLGLLLARRMQHEDAVRHLQEAARHVDTCAEARRALMVELAALGLRDAARDVLLAARAEDSSLPAELDEALRSQRRELTDARTPVEDTGEIVAGRYRLQRQLGSGSAGRVYLARDEVSGRRVAVKLLSAVHARGRAAFERFAREARVAGAMRHPNLVEVLDFSADQGYLAMELMTGGSLAERLDPRLSGPATRRMARDVLAGLELAHRRNIVHRDIKPPNIFFDARGTAKLGDFGVAHLLDLGATQTGGLIGTLAYMSPEQITGAPLTFAADQYALGVTLFHALTGRLPFLGPDFVAQHLSEEPPPVSSVEPDAEVAVGWDPVIAQLLAKSPADRFESVDALRKAIDAIDLGEAARPGVLSLPRTPRRRPETAGRPIAAVPNAPAEDTPRYAFETAIGRTEISRLARALDTALDRSVILERWVEEVAPADEQRLYVLARGGGPFLQRALAYDRVERVAVFEAPNGRTIGDALVEHPPSPRRAARLLKRLARAIAPVHAAGAAHGAIDETRIVVDDLGHPTLLACGLGPANPDASPAADCQALTAIVARAVGAEPATAVGLVGQLAAGVSDQQLSMLSIMAAAATAGEELYSFADALEIAILESQRSGRAAT